MASRNGDSSIVRSPKGRKQAVAQAGGKMVDSKVGAKSVAMNGPLTLKERNGTIKRRFYTKEDGTLGWTSNTVLHQRWSFKQLIFEIFLPEGFPHSVSADYVPYQIFDSIQALASSFTGTLSTKAMLQAVGVGNVEATATAATMQLILKDGSGMLGRIAFAWFQGSNLDSNAKTWRFMADILNDIAMTLEILTPSFPHLFLPLACSGSVLKAIVGAAGGATRAALTQHQARRDNMADVSSKDGSQETALVLIGMLVALIFNPLIGDSLFRTWLFFGIFTFIHLFANYLAVSFVAIDKLNRQRADLVIGHYLRNGMSEVLNPVETSCFERILFFQTNNSIILGATVEKFLEFSKPGTTAHKLGKKLRNPDRKYLLQESNGRVAVLFRHDSTSRDVLRSYFEAKLLQSGYSTASIQSEFLHFESLLQRSDWNVSTNLLSPSQIKIYVKEDRVA